MPQKLTGRSSEAGGIWHGPRNAAVSALTDIGRTQLAEGHSDSFQVHHQRRREIEGALEPNKGPSLVTLSAGRGDWLGPHCSLFCCLVYFVAAPIPELSLEKVGVI